MHDIPYKIAESLILAVFCTDFVQNIIGYLRKGKWPYLEGGYVAGVVAVTVMWVATSGPWNQNFMGLLLASGYWCMG